MSESASAEHAAKAAEMARDLATEAAGAAEEARNAAEEAAGGAAHQSDEPAIHEGSWTSGSGGDHAAEVDLSSGGGAQSGGPVDD
jgi:membrane protein involved in colicin uptake